MFDLEDCDNVSVKNCQSSNKKVNGKNGTYTVECTCGNKFVVKDLNSIDCPKCGK